MISNRMLKDSEAASDTRSAGFARAASNLIHERFNYVKGATHVHSSIEDSLSKGAGVCQDFAHMLLGRHAHARTARPLCFRLPGSWRENGKDSKQEEVIGGQASHAWAEVFIPNQGWTGFDPTIGKPVGLRHVRVAYGRDYGDVAPVRGVYRGRAGQRLSVDVCVRPVLDDAGNEQLSEMTTAPVAAASNNSGHNSPPSSSNNSNRNFERASSPATALVRGGNRPHPALP